MVVRKSQSAGAPRGANFRIEGHIQRDQPETQPGELKLTAYVFDKAGRLLGSADLDSKGNYSVAVGIAQAADVDLFVGPADMAGEIRFSSAYRKSFSAKEWKVEGSQARIGFDIVLPPDVWRPWWPLRICVSGHVRKISYEDGATKICPVPFVKVEIFDVDREFCLWPHIRRWWEWLLDRPVIRLPELLAQPPFPPRPFPGPDPAPDLKPGPIVGLRTVEGAALSAQTGLNAQPWMQASLSRMSANPATSVELNPQPEPPSVAAPQPGSIRVGEARLIDSSLASRLDRLVVTSKIEPWVLFPRCFYSKVEVCETTTDCNGYFICCFKWWPFHFRFGRLRFDSRPDIIVKVTQVIDGVPTVIYMDPYMSTRWNVTNTHIDLFLDNEDIVCGPGCAPQPEGTQVFFTRVGNDYVYEISQAAGTYHGGGLSNMAYGAGLYLQAAMGKGLTEAADPYYYRLSIGPGKGATAGPFKPITWSLADTRVSKATLISESHTLGPHIVNGQPALYEVRNTKDYYWYWPDLVGYWYTPSDVPDEGLYTVRLEVFDKNGVKLSSAVVDYRDGTVPPPAVLPAMPDHCDLVLQIDNVPPSITLDVPKAGSACGVVKFVDVPFDITTSVTQANGRLHWWRLHYVKGLSLTEVPLAYEPSDTSGAPAGLAPLPRNQTTSSAPFTAGLTTTCAFSLIVDAWSHIRNGYGLVYYKRLIKAIAVEKCS